MPSSVCDQAAGENAAAIAPSWAESVHRTIGSAATRVSGSRSRRGWTTGQEHRRLLL